MKFVNLDKIYQAWHTFFQAWPTFYQAWQAL